MNQSQQANLIKVAAVITASPRWVGALLAAEGLAMPDGWVVWWLPLSALLSAGMALVEGLAFSFVFNAWRVQKDKSANKLLWLALLSAIVFIAVLAPFIAAQVRAEKLSVVLGTGWALWVWSASVAASTIVIVASVGYAQKQKEPVQAKQKTATAKQSQKEPEQSLEQSEQIAHIARCELCGWVRENYKTERAATNARNAHKCKEIVCWCGESFLGVDNLEAHQEKHKQEAREAKNPAGAHIKFEELYGDNGKLPSIPTIREWRK